MNGFLQLAIGVCLIILCSGLVNWGNKHYSSRKRRDKKVEEEDNLIVKRLERVEQRLIEVQDVMIVLSEKIDRLEERKKELSHEQE